MYKYSLHKKSIKHICPQCQKKKLVLYIDNESGKYLSNIVGRCDREINCAYHFTPKSYFLDQKKEYRPFVDKRHIKEFKEISFHSKKELCSTLNNYEANNFVKYLYLNFDSEKVDKILDNYKIGTFSTWNNGTVFWQIDTQNRIRGGKIIIYSKTGKRTKFINWVHSVKIKNNTISHFNLNQCLFGEHLVSKSSKPIAIVESEKTACLMSMFFDKYLWLATGSLQGLNSKKLEILKNKEIILYPDLGIEGKNGSPFTKWKLASDELKLKGYNIKISNLLESKCTVTEREKGLDIADYFLKSIKQKPMKIISISNRKALKVYMKNKQLKTLIDVFDLTDASGNPVEFE